MRRRPVAPRKLRRLGWFLLLAGALLAAAGVAVRDRRSEGDGPVYLLDGLGFLLAVGGAVLVARVGAMFLEFAPAGARRGAILEAVGGIAAALAGCVGLGAVAADGVAEWLRPVLAAGLIGGIGVGLTGLLTLGWFYGLDWAAGRMERLDRAEVEKRRRRSERKR